VLRISSLHSIEPTEPFQVGQAIGPQKESRGSAGSFLSWSIECLAEVQKDMSMLANTSRKAGIASCCCGFVGHGLPSK